MIYALKSIVNCSKNWFLIVISDFVNKIKSVSVTTVRVVVKKRIFGVEIIYIEIWIPKVLDK